MQYPYNGVLSSLKRNEVLICGITWMNTEDIMLSGRSQTEKAIYSIISFISKLQIDKFRDKK